jgi:dTMP kinase
VHAAFPCQRGMLVSTEGITGVGKTYLTARVRTESQPSAAGAVILEEFSRRPARGELGHDLLHALISAADGDPFLRGGHPGGETLLLLAIKTYDYEAYCAPALYRGQLVLEGRSMHCVAVYQSLILHPGDDEQAYDEMRAILDIAARWRPLPDLTFLITNDVNAAVERAERRDRMTFSPEHRRFHHRAAAHFDRLAADAPSMVTLIDRRHLSNSDAIAHMRARIDEQQRVLSCMGHARLPGSAESSPCMSGCRLADGRSSQRPPATAGETATRDDVRAPQQP